MKNILIAATFAILATPVFADVGVNLRIGEPNFFGRIDIGDAPHPRLYASRPVVIARERVVEEPVYLRVPASHRAHWARYCGRYDACNRPVYFVRDDWYRNSYVPVYRQHHPDWNHDYSDDHHDHQEYRAEHGHN